MALIRAHSLRVDPDPFAAILKGYKRFEWRSDDREMGFAPGDTLHLREHDGYHFGGYTGRSVVARVTYILRGGISPQSTYNKYGVPDGYVVMGFVMEDDEIKPVAADRCEFIKAEDAEQAGKQNWGQTSSPWSTQEDFIMKAKRKQEAEEQAALALREKAEQANPPDPGDEPAG